MSGPGLASKRIIVTGGGGRLGSRMVRHFSEHGADVAAVVVSDAEQARVPTDTGTPVRIMKALVTSETSVVDVFADIADGFGGLDALVHTIGMWSGRALLDTTQSEWEEMIQVNLTSTFLCFREAVRHMDGPGTLIALSSRQGADGGVAQQAAYSAAKAGIIRLVESISDEHGDRGIHAHAIAPSTILFDAPGDGVDAHDIVSLSAFLIAEGAPLSGTTLRSYGSG